MASRNFLIAQLFKHQRSSECRGAAATEMALIAPVFFLFLIGITEMSFIYGAQQLLENAAFNATRLAKTGYSAGGSTQAQTVSQVVNNELQSYGNLIDVSKVTITSAAYNSFASINGSSGTNGYGSAQQIVVYTISYPWTLFTPMMGKIIGTWNSTSQSWVVNLTSQIVVRNEPYG
jgi:Flp pilus assembly protein TadG